MTVSRSPDSTARLLRAGVIIFGAYHLIVGAFLAFAPHLFFRTLGGFGTYNRHYSGDNATFDLALGGGLLAAVGRPGWQAPLLVVTAAQAVLHAVNHFVDWSNADPAWTGAFDALSITALAAAAVWLVVLALRPRG